MKRDDVRLTGRPDDPFRGYYMNDDPIRSFMMARVEDNRWVFVL